MPYIANTTYLAVIQATSCGNCGMPFGLPKDFMENRIADGQKFWCPNGHKIGWGDTEEKRLKRDLKWAKDELAAQRARADGAEASLRTTKGHVTRLRKRMVEGECPLCGQHLRDLARHVARVHPFEQVEVE